MFANLFKQIFETLEFLRVLIMLQPLIPIVK